MCSEQLPTTSAVLHFNHVSPRQQAGTVAQPSLRNDTTLQTAVFLAQPGTAAFEPDVLLTDTGSNTALFTSARWFGNTRSRPTGMFLRWGPRYDALGLP